VTGIGPGTRVLVTGASRGIGAALAAALRAEGCDVVGAARTEGPGVDACDVSRPDDVAALFARTGPVDVVVNNAALIHEPAPLWEVPHVTWERLFAVNVLGMVSVLRAYVPPMNERGSGVVVNLSSGWGRSGAGRQSPYCSTKFAVEGLTESLAQEVAPGVVVLAVNPGVVATSMLETCFEQDVSGFTPPGECAASFVRMLRRVGPDWNGRSLDAPAF